MKTLFDLMDDKKTGLVRLADIEQRWQDDGAKGLPHGVIECLSKVTPLNGMLTFERFCAGLKICLLRNQSDSNKSRQSLTNNNDNNSSDKKLQRPPSAPLLDLENSVSGSTQWNSNNTAAVRPNNAIPVQRTLSLPKLCPEKDGDNTTPEPYIIPGLYAPPKPPRTALVMGNGVTNINNLDRFDKAEIRHALQNWQMGILMNEMDNKDKKYTVNQLNRGTADGQPQNNLFQKKTNVRRREPRRHTLQNGIDYNLLKKLKQLEQEKAVLLEGLNAVDVAQEWYLKQISTVQDKIKHLGRMGSHVEQWSEAHQERLDLQRARVMEVNRYLSGLAESWERGGFPMHMNL
ncbi:Suppressor APC domain-containing protein 2, partial [Pseudolycoriella hygida]